MCSSVYPLPLHTAHRPSLEEKTPVGLSNWDSSSKSIPQWSHKDIRLNTGLICPLKHASYIKHLTKFSQPTMFLVFPALKINILKKALIRPNYWTIRLKTINQRLARFNCTTPWLFNFATSRYLDIFNETTKLLLLFISTSGTQAQESALAM